jgi:formylglycine-generating enzyme required for sulfatase activity
MRRAGRWLRWGVVALCALAALAWLTRGVWLTMLAGHFGDFGDIGGFRDCDAQAVLHGRPITESAGCLVPLPPVDFERFKSDTAVDLPADRFIMGAQSDDPDGPHYDPDADADESPPHEVRLTPFWMQRHEVSVERFRWCVRVGACRADDVEQSGGYFNYGREHRDRHPVNGVTWFGARDYCAWVGGRLPTEAEWEFAARAGRLQRRYPWEQSEAPTCKHAVFGGGSAGMCGIDSTAEVAYYPPLGENRASWVEHMSGNVWEWTADWYAEDAYAKSAAVDPRGPETGTARVQRGGGWSDDDASVLRTTFRAQMDPTMKLADIGFRCVSDRGPVR